MSLDQLIALGTLALSMAGGAWAILQMAVSRMDKRDADVRTEAKIAIAAQAEITKMTMQLEFAKAMEANNKVIYETISNVKSSYMRRDDFERTVGELKAEMFKIDDKLDNVKDTMTSLTQRVIDALARSKPATGAE